MTVFMIDDIIKSLHITNFYKLLLGNETNFNRDQKLGLSYQLMKAMVRKKTGNYKEINLKPEFIYGPYDDTAIQNIMFENITGLNNNDDVKHIYTTLMLPENKQKLRSYVIGSELEHQTDITSTTSTQVENKLEVKVSYNRVANNINFVNTYSRDSIGIIEHKNCKACILNVSTKVFNNDDYKINDKQIYISYNLLILKDFDLKQKYDFEYLKLKNIIDGDKWCFVELDEYILIENEYIASNYYAYYVPVYDLYGNHINPVIGRIMHKLDINTLFGKLIGLKGYSKYKHTPTELLEIASKLKFQAKIILKFNIIVSSVYRYNLSNELVRILNETNMPIINLQIYTKLVNIISAFAKYEPKKINEYITEYKRIIELVEYDDEDIWEHIEEPTIIFNTINLAFENKSQELFYKIKNHKIKLGDLLKKLEKKFNEKSTASMLNKYIVNKKIYNKLTHK